MLSMNAFNFLDNGIDRNPASRSKPHSFISRKPQSFKLEDTAHFAHELHDSIDQHSFSDLQQAVKPQIPLGRLIFSKRNRKVSLQIDEVMEDDFGPSYGDSKPSQPAKTKET